MKSIDIHRLARAELDDAMDYYEQCRNGLGNDLLAKFEEALTLVQRNPGQGAPHEDTEFRKFFLKRFPYTVYYSELDDRIWVAAFSHQKRKPNYWRRRRPT